MQKSLITLTLAIVVLVAPRALATEEPLPHTPNTSQTVTSTLTAEVVAPVVPEVVRSREDTLPVRVSIPKISLDDPIQNMGVLKNGDLDVPNGKTNNVGWYKDGTIPGQQGSAVFDAHVFAAFKNLNKLKAGDDIYVTQSDGAQLHFKVEETKLYKLGNLSPQTLFARADKKRLNLITCAGNLTADRSTYDHRLVVYAVLIE